MSNNLKFEMIRLGLEDLCKLISPHRKTREKARELILFLREGPMTKQEIKNELDLSEMQFKSLVKKMREIGLLTGRKTGDSYKYYLSYEGFNMWLKMLRDTVYNLLKRRD